MGGINEVEGLQARVQELTDALVVETNMLEAQERILDVHVQAGSNKNEEEVRETVKNSRKRLRLLQDTKKTLSEDLEKLLAEGAGSLGQADTAPPAARSHQRGTSKSSFRGHALRTQANQHLKLSVDDSIRVKEIDEELGKEQLYLNAAFNLLSQESTQASKKELLKAQASYRNIKLRITSLDMEKLRITAKEEDIENSPEALLLERMHDLERRIVIEAKVEEAASRMMKIPTNKKQEKSKSPNSDLLSQWGQAHRRLDLLQLSMINCKKRLAAHKTTDKQREQEQPPNLHGKVKLRINEVKGMLNPRHLNDPSDKCQPFLTLITTGFHGRKDLTTKGTPKTNDGGSFTDWHWDKATDKTKSMVVMEVEAVKELEIQIHYVKDQLVGLAHITLDKIIDGRMHALEIEMHPQGYISLDINFTPPNAPPAVNIKRRYAMKRRPQKPLKRSKGRESKNREGWRSLKKFLVKGKDEEKKKAKTMPSPARTRARTQALHDAEKESPSQRRSMDVVGGESDIPGKTHHRSFSDAITPDAEGDRHKLKHVQFSPTDSDNDTEREETDIDDLIRRSEQDISGAGGVRQQAAQLSVVDMTVHIEDEELAVENLSVDSFDFHAVLGMGNFGKVMLAEVKGTGVLYALKFIKKDFIISEEEVAAVEMEKRIFMKATKANHPYIVKMYAGFQTEERVCFALEYAGGGDLMYHIHQGIFDEARAQFYSIECFMALEFLHEHGIIYRDLKLDNVLLDQEGHVKLADFGLCKENMWEGDRTSTFCGTPEFIAPEILVDDTYTRAVDWWAYGVLVYEMMVGESPFPGEDEEEIFNSVLRENIVYPFFLNPDSNSLLRSLLIRKPEMRLGGRGDAAEVKQHSFFKKVDFAKYMARAVKPPFVPMLSSSTDLRYFDPEFTSLPKRLTVMRPKLTTKDQGLFRTFSFVHKEFYNDKGNNPVSRDSIKKTAKVSYDE